eukprot:365203-Chlamydomonas_euryale.AAC.8
MISLPGIPKCISASASGHRPGSVNKGLGVWTQARALASRRLGAAYHPETPIEGWAPPGRCGVLTHAADLMLCAGAHFPYPGSTPAPGRCGVAYRPYPVDGHPLVGFAADGLYVCVTHSGMTLGPHLGRLVAGEVSVYVCVTHSGMTLGPHLGRLVAGEVSVYVCVTHSRMSLCSRLGRCERCRFGFGAVIGS